MYFFQMIVLKPPWPATCIILWYQLTWNWRWPQPTSLANEFPLWSQIWQPYLSGWLSSLVRLSRRLITKSPLAPTNPLWAFWTYFLVGYFPSLQLLKFKTKNIAMFFFSFFISVSTEFILDSTMSNAAGFQYFGGPYVTVLSSKTSQRYRLQSDNLACLWILTETLENRLSKRFANEKHFNVSILQSTFTMTHEFSFRSFLIYADVIRIFAILESSIKLYILDLHCTDICSEVFSLNKTRNQALQAWF